MKILDIEELEEGKIYKVSQLTIDGEPMIFFVEDASGCYHRNILTSILQRNGITPRPTKVFSGSGPATNGERYAVEGMGGAHLLGEKCLLLFGNSFEYGINISVDHSVRLRKEKLPDWRFKMIYVPTGEEL